MKKLLFALFAVALFVYSPSTVNALDNLPLIAKTKVVEGKTIQLNLANLQKVYTRVEVTNFDQSTLYFEDNIRKHNGYINRINLEQLRDGIYHLTVRNNKKTYKQVVKIRDGKIYLSQFTK